MTSERRTAADVRAEQETLRKRKKHDANIKQMEADGRHYAEHGLRGDARWRLNLSLAAAARRAREAARVRAEGGGPVREGDFTIRIDQLADGRYVAHVDEAGREIRTLPAEPTYGKAHALALSKVATIVADRR